MTLPSDCDTDKLAEVAMAIMHLTSYGPEGELRASKGLGWDVLGLLFERGWIEDPRTGHEHSVRLTDDGQQEAVLMYEKHFEIGVDPG